MSDHELFAYLPELVGRHVPIVARQELMVDHREFHPGDVIKRVQITSIRQVPRRAAWQLYPGFSITAHGNSWGRWGADNLLVQLHQINNKLGPVEADVRSALRRVVADRLRPALAYLPLPRDLITYLAAAI